MNQDVLKKFFSTPHPIPIISESPSPQGEGNNKASTLMPGDRGDYRDMRINEPNRFSR